MARNNWGVKVFFTVLPRKPPNTPNPLSLDSFFNFATVSKFLKIENFLQLKTSSLWRSCLELANLALLFPVRRIEVDSSYHLSSPLSLAQTSQRLCTVSLQPHKTRFRLRQQLQKNTVVSINHRSLGFHTISNILFLFLKLLSVCSDAPSTSR